MLLAYCDDSGEAKVSVLATVIVVDQRWLELDAWTGYRRWLRGGYGYRLSKGFRSRNQLSSTRETSQREPASAGRHGWRLAGGVRRCLRSHRVGQWPQGNDHCNALHVELHCSQGDETRYGHDD